MSAAVSRGYNMASHYSARMDTQQDKYDQCGTYGRPFLRTAAEIFNHRGTYGSPLLRTATETFNPEQPAELRALLKAKANIHERDGNGNSCLHLLVGSAQANETAAVHSLTALIRAGADPSQPNLRGDTVFDVACDHAPPAFGSFRRDLLLQALLESGKDIVDDRLLRPTRLTAVYNKMRHEILFGDRSSYTESELRKALLEKLRDSAWNRNLTSDRKLPEAALERTLSSHALAASTDADSILQEALQYLELMCEGKKQIVHLCKQRIYKETFVRLGDSLHLLHMAENSNTTALLEFDWWRPVDIEDLFSTYIDSFIDQLEDLHPNSKEQMDNVRGLIDMLQNAVPSYSASLSQRPEALKTILEERPDSAKGLDPLMIDTDILTPGDCGSYSDWLNFDEDSVAERERKESIAKTPVEYYGEQL